MRGGDEKDTRFCHKRAQTTGQEQNDRQADDETLVITGIMISTHTGESKTTRIRTRMFMSRKHMYSRSGEKTRK